MDQSVKIDSTTANTRQTGRELLDREIGGGIRYAIIKKENLCAHYKIQQQTHNNHIPTP